MSVLPRNIPVTAATPDSDDYVQLDGTTNRSRKFLANQWAFKASPVFTGTPTAPTPTGSTPKALVTVDYLPTAMAVAAVRDAAYAALMPLLYPVGEILITHRTGNPNSWLGFGTWAAYGAGKVLTGLDTGDVDFNAIDKTGGVKTHTLSVANLPNHSHTIPVLSGSTSTVSDHTHDVPHYTGSGSFTGLVPDTSANPGALTSTTTTAAGGHNHSFSTTASNTTATSGATATAFSNLSPFIVVAMWLRTA